MRLGVVGGRNFINYPLMEETIKSLDSVVSLMISGGAFGADSLARDYAEENEIPFIEFRPEPSDIRVHGFGKAAAMRNQRIVDNCDMLLAFPDPNSRGTWITVRMAEKKGIPVKVVEE